MKNRINLFFTLILIMFSCSNDSDEKQDMSFDDLNCDTNYDYDVDIDEDGVIDFTFSCNKAFPGAVLGNEDGHLFGNILPKENTYILIKNLSGALFLSTNESFDSNIEDNSYFWSENSWFLVNKKWRTNSGWDDNWNPMSVNNRYFLGFKLENSDVDELGWMELQFDSVSGEITILQSSITTDNTITVN